MDNEKIDSRMVTSSQSHTQPSFYDDDFETECAVEISPQHQPTETRHVSLIEPAAVEAVVLVVTPAIDPTLFRILEQIQIQNTAFQQAQQQTNETLAMAICRPITVAQQTKPPTLPPISSGPQGQQDIASFEAHMKTYGVNKSTWSTELRAPLRGDLTNLAMSINAH